MPLHSGQPTDDYARRFAERLHSLDDGKTHLWLEPSLPSVGSIGALLWDELVGVFCLDVRGIEVGNIRTYSADGIEVLGMGWSQSPILGIRATSHKLMDHLRSSGITEEWIAPVVAWPLIGRTDWTAAGLGGSAGGTASMLFADDLRGDAKLFRAALRRIRSQPHWGSAPAPPFCHRDSELASLRDLLAASTDRGLSSAPPPNDGTSLSVRRANAAPSTGDPGRAMIQSPGGDTFRDRVWLGTETVVAAAQALRAAAMDLAPIMENEWGHGYIDRVDKIEKRLSQPFRLGIIGEFRAGKSSLVNALIGRDVAIVREMECTFARQRFYYSDVPEGTIYTRGGAPERCSVDDVRSRLGSAYTSRSDDGIERTEIGLPAPILKGIEIWDSPGLGGSSDNAEVARQFAGEIDAALWVFDMNFTGQRAIGTLLASLRERGKTIIGIVNKCEYLASDEFTRLLDTLKKAYESVPFAEFVAVSAELAVRPDSGRGADVQWAVDDSGNIGRLMEVIRKAFQSCPGRISSQAAAGDLRALAFSVRDDVQEAALTIRRREHLVEMQVETSERLFREHVSLIEREAIRSVHEELRQYLIGTGLKCLEGMSPKQLRDTNHVKKSFERFLSSDAMRDFLGEFFVRWQPRVRDALSDVGARMEEQFRERLTGLDRPSEVRSPDQDAGAPITDFPKNLSLDVADITGGDPSRFPDALATATLTGAALAWVGLLVPGPHWPVVLFGAAIAGLVRFFRGDAGPSDSEILASREGSWHKAVNSYCEQDGLPESLRECIQEYGESLCSECLEPMKRCAERLAYGGRKRGEQLARLERLEALRERVERVIGDLGDARLALPPADEMLKTEARFEPGARERTHELLDRLMARSSQVLAITDGSFTTLSMSLLSKAPGTTAIRLLTWGQLVGPASEAFRNELENLRRKRDGSVAVAAPLSPSEGTARAQERRAPLPEGSWLFVPGWAYQFDQPLSVVWAASAPIHFTPHEDAGELYEKHFRRWWDNEVAGYQTVPLR